MFKWEENKKEKRKAKYKLMANLKLYKKNRKRHAVLVV